MSAISLHLRPEQEALREEVRSWLRTNQPPRVSLESSLADFVSESRRWQASLAAQRFIGLFFPEEFGGRGLSLVEEAIVQEELARVGAPQLVGLFGITMVAPVLVRHGTPEQQRRFIAKILAGEEIWCQGFSEPGAGSDLASLRTEAVRVDGGFKISGQKVWTSFAQYADWCFVLVRTEAGVAKHKGLSYLLVPMTSPGITVRPLTQITGEQEFNELFFEEVFVPEANLVGAPGQGWEIAISTLMFERVILTFARHLQSDVALREIGETIRLAPTKELSETFGRLSAKAMALRALALSHLVTYSREHNPGAEGSLDKLLWSETFQEITRFGLRVLGERATYLTDDSGGLVSAANRYLYSRGRTIAAGTSEIQRSIIAERVLGLPRG